MLTCAACNHRYPDGAQIWKCECGGYLNYDFDSPVHIDRKVISSRPPTMWRYAEALPPLAPESRVSLGETMTPLVPVSWAGHEVHMKVDFLMPTGSFKDRGAAMMLSRSKASGITHIIEDSSGNAGSSIAAYASRAGIRADVYVPAYASAGKKVQISIYGANLVEIPGTREDTSKAAMKATENTFYGSHNWSPFFIEGVKTQAFEVWEQLGWKAPDVVVAPAGYGSSLLGNYYAWRMLAESGQIDAMPRLMLVQSENCDPIVRALRAGLKDVPAIQKKETIAEGISCSSPIRGKEMLQAVRDSGGTAVSVSDSQSWQAVLDLARSGIYVEPTAGAAPAAARKLIQEGLIKPGETVVVPLTGIGLKATDKILHLLDEGV